MVNNLSLPVLETVNGGFLITRHDKLSTINFPKLATVTGAIAFYGAFDKATLPSLTNVKGGFNMQSSGNFSCETFNSWRKDNTIHGDYKCESEAKDPSTADGFLVPALLEVAAATMTRMVPLSSPVLTSPSWVLPPFSVFSPSMLCKLPNGYLSVVDAALSAGFVFSFAR